MNLEENRLLTFNAWPATARSPHDRTQLARRGFFATTATHPEVECNWCHFRFDDWETGNDEKVYECHRRTAPYCLILGNVAGGCANIHSSAPVANTNTTTIIMSTTTTTTSTTSTTTSSSSTASSSSSSSSSSSQQQQQQQQEEDLYIEANRLATFGNWPNPNISPQSLAKAGFFYLNHSDEVKCAWCKGVIAKWEREDNAFEEHKRFFPDCPRVQLIEMASDGIRDLGIQQISPPKRPKYASLDTRLRSYTNWPIRDIQSPEALAQAGLYYQDVDDHVRCFHCYIGLRSWQKEDDPWHEHAKWYPQCQFVNLVKGTEYVQHVQEMTRRQADQSTSTAAVAMTIDEAMATAPVLHALEMGLDVGSLRSATYQRLLATGRPYHTVEDLLKAVFGDREDDDYAENANEEGAGTTSLIRDVSRIINQIISATDDNLTSDTTRSSAADVTVTATEGATANATTTTTTTTTIANPTNSNAATVVVAQHDTQPKDTPKVSESSGESCTVSSLRTGYSSKRCLSLEEENRALKDARLCKVCLDEEVGIVFLPCGHFVTCVQCAPSVTQCPMCRSAIKGFVRTYLS